MAPTVRCLVLLAVLLPASGCDETPTGPTVPIGQAFELRQGESAAIARASMTVRFDRVIGDSRCPADAFCVLGGDAIVRITVTDRGEVAYDLHTGSMAPVQHGDATIELVQLLPYPFSTRQIDPEDYRATLRVTR